MLSQSLVLLKELDLPVICWVIPASTLSALDPWNTIDYKAGEVMDDVWQDVTSVTK